MDAYTMMKTAALLLAIAAGGGLLMAGIRFSGKDRPPSAIAMLHGLLAAGALTLLIYAAVVAGVPPMAQLSIAVLVVAALIGTWINLKFHSQMQALPIKGVVAHALVAVAGFVLLLVVLLRPHAG
ncbi:MAG: hypothetical protein WC809_09670 [Sinimarinibacterium sp.]|jgi:hypothetical protein